MRRCSARRGCAVDRRIHRAWDRSLRQACWKNWRTDWCVFATLGRSKSTHASVVGVGQETSDDKGQPPRSGKAHEIDSAPAFLGLPFLMEALSTCTRQPRRSTDQLSKGLPRPSQLTVEQRLRGHLPPTRRSQVYPVPYPEAEHGPAPLGSDWTSTAGIGAAGLAPPKRPEYGRFDGDPRGGRFGGVDPVDTATSRVDEDPKTAKGPQTSGCPPVRVPSRASDQSGRPDLNRGPHRPERCALPGCATPRERRLSQSGARRPSGLVAAGPLLCAGALFRRWR